jgi:parallel beta-helix repeat protein
MRSCSTRTVLSLSVLGVVITAAVLYAGPLNPPAGPVASTYKTLTEVEPRIAVNAVNTPGDADSLLKITQPGSYYLTGNITGVVGKHGIEIAADSVVLDLRGFAVLHSGAGLDGISTAGASRVSITIRNGTVSAWGTGGIDLDGTGHIIENVHARVNIGDGISVGATALLRACQASGNQGVGIRTSDGSTIDGCAANNNTGAGVVVTEGCTLTNSVAKSNGGIGVDSGGGCAITGCSATDNTGSGFRSVDSGLDDGGTTLTNCSACGNGADGFSGTLAITFTGCSARRNTGIGFSMGAGSATNSSASFNTGGGFEGFQGCAFNACSAFNNGGIGFDIKNAGSITNCASRANSLDGITAASGCIILGNTCSGNGPTATGGSGIFVSGSDCRIEGNNCTGNNDFGIEVEAAGNIIIKNTCSGNTVNWAIVANNYYGPIVNRVGVATVAQGGNGTGVDALANTHPNANFSY